MINEDAAPAGDRRTSPAPTDQESRRTRAGSARTRSAVVAIVGVLAVVSMVAGILGFWTLRTATDSDRFEERVETVLRREDVSDALARRVVAELGEAIDLRAEVVAVVPTALVPAVDLLLAGARSRVELALGEQLRTDRFVELVGSAAGRAHASAVRVLEGDDVIDGVAVVDGEVRINLLPLLATALELTQQVGLFRNVAVPELERGGDPDVQRAELSTALGRTLPPDFGEVAVFSGESLDELGATVQLVRDVLLFAKRTFWLLLGLGIGLGALAIWMSVQRWRTAAYLVAGLFAAALVVRLAIRRAGDRLPDALEQPGARGTIAELASGIESSLSRSLIGFSVAALAVLVAAFWVSARYPVERSRSSSPAAGEA